MHPMQWPSFFLASLIDFWLSLIFMLSYWPRVSSKSTSRHAASSSKAYLFFTVVQIVAGVVAFLFFREWFIPYFSLPMLLRFTIFGTIGLQLLAAVIPDKETGRASMLHLRIANLMALGILACMVLLVAHTGFSTPVRTVFALAALYMVICAILIGSKSGMPERLSQYLYFQVAYIFIFHASILLATYS